MCLLVGDTKNYKALKERVIGRGVAGVTTKKGIREDHTDEKRDMSRGLPGRNDLQQGEERNLPKEG